MVELRRIGFTVEEIEQMEVTQRASIYLREIDINEKKRIIRLLDMAEAVNNGYFGSQPKNKKQNPSKEYGKWRNYYIKILNPEIVMNNNIWDKIPKKGKF